MMKMAMSHRAEIHFNPFRAVIDPLAINPQRSGHLMNRLTFHGGINHPHLRAVERGSLTERNALTLVTRHEWPAALGRAAQKAAHFTYRFALADPQ